MIEPVFFPPVADATETAAMIRRGDISAVEGVDAAIARAEALQPVLNFLIAPLFEQARARAAAPGLEGPFAGVPYLVKDMYDVPGVQTRWGSRMTSALPPATAPSSSIAKLEEQGLVVIGKTALGEFGFLPTTEPLAFGPTLNPWNLTRTPGGSSGGSAAAVAAGVVPFADAADGGGSIRIPASACGLFGMKPSTGRLVGAQAPAGRFDLTVEHCLSRSVRDSATLFAATERSADESGLPFVGLVSGPAQRRLRIGYLSEGIAAQMPAMDVADGLDATIRLLEQLGHHVDATTWPIDGDVLVRDFTLAFSTGAAAAVGMAREMLGHEPDETMFEPFTLNLARLGASFGVGDVDAALVRQQAMIHTYRDWFTRFDVILSPVLLTPPVETGWIAGDVPATMLSARIFDFMNLTNLQNYVAAPAMSVPLHWTADGLPVGMQFAADVGQERLLFELAFELEAACPWAHRRPPVFAS
ncbi:6-aminohexanoate hydrolase [Sphingomonas sp. So64.6b]|uniref:amidase family protein n=1 Tax=Sphingomonas sp. So64.6b TaxID=2997354 RepID=UPI00160033E4|nr:amidase family protein [Sphingomonas sp. So64.6b]QNA84362.1 6-aminohexanoate hydrolase [Sphingomonas sp. So64.6b]